MILDGLTSPGPPFVAPHFNRTSLSPALPQLSRSSEFSVLTLLAFGTLKVYLCKRGKGYPHGWPFFVPRSQ